MTNAGPLLMVALGSAGLSMGHWYDLVLWALRSWLDSRVGIGRIAASIGPLVPGRR